MSTGKALEVQWRASLAHKVEQAWRFTRIALGVFVAQVVAQVATLLISTGDLHGITHMDQKALVALLAGAAEAAYRQVRPALTVTAAATVPTPIGGGVVVSADDLTPVGDSSGNVAVTTAAPDPAP